MLHKPLSTTKYEEELNYITQIVVNSGYSHEIVDQIIFKKLHKQALQLCYYLSKNERSKIISSLSYIGQESVNISNFFKSRDIHTAFRTNTSLSIFIRNNKCNLKNCKNQEFISSTVALFFFLLESFIEQRGLTFKERIENYKDIFRSKDSKSNYDDHIKKYKAENELR